MPDATYSFAGVAKILDISENKLRYWAQVGFVGPSLRGGGKMLFNFQDLISVKAAKELVDRGFSPAEVRKALAAVRGSLPHVDRPLDRIRVAFDGETLVVVDDDGAYELTGQKVFAFGLGDLARRVFDVGGVAPAPDAAANPVAAAEAGAAPEPDAPGRGSAYDWFLEGIRLEAEPAGLDEAVACYRKALALDPGLAAAHNNLGQIAYAKGDVLPARAAFEAALAIDPDQPEARFNLANLILESGDLELAVAEFRRVLQIQPDFADAHYNLAVALERLGGRAQARAHLERYLGLESETAPWATQARTLIQRLAETA
ncbi:MAG TPA: tetratricopeptide repeat protein [Polyangia bacterium]|jgi:tetratricopeptide (TPR) repeat protein|nr:tetratricopeptide repeat protein [Polyangia bacterium]